MFFKETINMSRRQTSLIVQLRSSHIPLNLHLHCIHKSKTPSCPHCSLQGRQTPELVKHFVMDCPAYAKERHWLRGKLGHLSYSLKDMFTKEKPMRALIGL